MNVESWAQRNGRQPKRESETISVANNNNNEPCTSEQGRMKVKAWATGYYQWSGEGVFAHVGLKLGNRVSQAS